MKSETMRKISQKERDKLIFTSQNKLSKITDELLTDLTMLQYISK
jgi:hypothetical protein